MPVYLLNANPEFPPVEFAEPDGVLAVGGDLTTDRLLVAYSNGIFPWYSKGDPILWWSPDPRMVLYPKDLKVSKSMRAVLRNRGFIITFDTDFESVIRSCGETPRQGQDGTWLTSEMINAYLSLHEEGYAHSVEVWKEKELVGGLYGISLGHAFFGESMFTRESNASKVGFIHLVKTLESAGFTLIDCQVYTKHLESLGAIEVPRKEFLKQLKESLQHTDMTGSWKNLPAEYPVKFP